MKNPFRLRMTKRIWFELQPGDRRKKDGTYDTVMVLCYGDDRHVEYTTSHGVKIQEREIPSFHRSLMAAMKRMGLKR